MDRDSRAIEENAGFFPLDVLDEILDVIESVSQGFLTYSFGFLPTFKRICYPRLLTFLTRTTLPMRKFAERSKQPFENMMNF